MNAEATEVPLAIEKSEGQLNGGQKPRLAIARALIRDPLIFIFNEATSAVGSVSESLIQSAIREVSRGRHMNTVKNVDTIYMLGGGEVLEHGSHWQSMAREGRYHKLFTASVSFEKAA